MAKVDVSVTRSMTINTGNYESIKPTVTLTVRDVDSNRVDDAYLALDKVIGGLFKMEVYACASEGHEVSKGLTDYVKYVGRNAEQIGSEIESSLKELDKF